MFVDGGAAVNVMPYTMFRKLGMGLGDLTPTSIVLNMFGPLLSVFATVLMSSVLNSSSSADLSNFGPGTFLTCLDLLLTVI
jgi:hypothetical protein